MTDQLKLIAKSYFKAFSAKKIDLIESMFADDVSLKDWEIEAHGKHDVISANIKIFESVQSIDVQLLNLISENATVAAELRVVVNKIQVIEVLDLLRFNKSQHIVSINAFKSRQFLLT